MLEQPPNSPFLVDLKPVPTLNAFAYIPNMNSYIQGLILEDAVCMPPYIPNAYNTLNISMETELAEMEKMVDVLRCTDSISVWYLVVVSVYHSRQMRVVILNRLLLYMGYYI